MASKLLPSNAARNELQTLGENISIARKRRRLTIRHMAEAASVTPETIRRLEKGEPGVSIGTLAMVILALGECGRLEKLLSPSTDDIGMVISVHDLPKRVREKGKSQKTADHTGNLGNIGGCGKYMGF